MMRNYVIIVFPLEVRFDSKIPFLFTAELLRNVLLNHGKGQVV